MPRLWKERGDANLLGLVFALPILLLLFAIAFDWLREPLARQALRYALYHGVYHVAPNYDCVPPFQPPCVGSDLDGVIIGNFTHDPSTPSGYSFCEASGALWGGGAGALEQPTCLQHKPAMLSGYPSQNFGASGASSVSSDFIRKISVLAVKYLTEGGSGIFDYDPSDIGVQITLMRPFGMRDDGLAISSNADIGEVQFYRYYWPSDVDDRFRIPLWAGSPDLYAPKGTPGDILSRLIEAAQTSDPSGPYRIVWGVEPCSGAGSDICHQRYFQSVWVVAVGYLRLNSLFGKWSLFGSSTDDPKENIITEYVVRPLNSYASLEVLN